MPGRVVIVGGGPGDPDLITVRGLDRLLAADVVIADRLGPSDLLDQLPPHVEVVDASRTPEGRAISQDEINRRLVDGARAGQTVVRLKGGDPFVLAHGYEELQACLAADVPVEVVPGVTSATAAPALAGIALTHRDGAQGFTVVSGHLAPDDPASRLDWGALARSGTTLVLLMAVGRLPLITRRLLDEGLDPATASACVADASRPTEQVVRAPLAELADAVERAGLANPAVVVIEAAARPMRSRRVLVLGGARSGKSHFAEQLLVDEPDVVYVATAARGGDDPEWAERIRKHRERRPARWSTNETLALAELLGADGPALLVDGITTWLAGVMDESGFWAGDRRELDRRLEQLRASWRAGRRTVVAVSDEVGSGIVPETSSGRAFRDELGRLNQELAAASDEVWLVTAGIPRRLR